MRRSRLPAKSACSSDSQTTLSSLGTNGKSDRTFLPDVREAKSASLDTRAFQFRGVQATVCLYSQRLIIPRYDINRQPHAHGPAAPGFSRAQCELVLW